MINETITNDRNATTEEVHKRLLYMAKIIAEILERNAIPYSLAYGTLLGAVRHQGFIPWDQDFDLWIFDETYDKALECLKAELPNDLFLENEDTEPKYFHAWAHVKDKNSTVRHNRYQQDDYYSHHGLYVDLYRVWKVKECDLNTFLNLQNRRYINRRKELELISDEEYDVRLQKLMEDEKDAIINKTKSDEEVYALLNVYKCKHLYAKYVFPLKKYRFEDTSFFGINRAGDFLTDLYGDYMTPPPVEERGDVLDHVSLF